MAAKEDCRLGDSILAAASLTYLGPLSSAVRVQVHQKWLDLLKKGSIKHSEHCSFDGDLTGRSEAPLNDRFSQENAILLAKCTKCPLVIDPQGQARGYIKAFAKKDLEIMSRFDEAAVRRAMNMGKFVLFENISEQCQLVAASLYSSGCNNLFVTTESAVLS